MENYINVKNRKLYFEKNFRSFLIDSMYIQIFLLKKILIHESNIFHESNIKHIF